MIRANRASLTIHSDRRTVAEISAGLGCEPDDAGDIGELTPSGRAGRDVSPERVRYARTFWSLTERDDGDDRDDETGFASLRRLVAFLEPHAGVLAELRRGGETVIWWSGDSDSTQGGFVLEADLIGSLHALGCDVYGTAYLDEPAQGTD